jgi:hypothetical protein
VKEIRFINKDKTKNKIVKGSKAIETILKEYVGQTSRK